MKILVTNNTLGPVGGSETYAYALIKELNRRNDIEVHAFSPRIGMIGKKLISEGIKVINRITEDYDLVLASHTSTIPFLKNIKGKKIQTCHGIYPSLEQPINGVDYHVSISQEVYNHIIKKGFKSTIIHNGIDCKRFSPKNQWPHEKLTRVLSLSQSEDLNKTISKVCKEMNIELVILNKFKNGIFNVEDEMIKSDLVISLGRGAYEAMACGRSVMILDKRSYIKLPPIGDGMVKMNNINEILKFNCSGRYSKKIFNSKEIKAEFLKYNFKDGQANREYALEHLNINKQVNKYLAL